MAAYTFGTVAVYDPISDTVVENATGGKLVAVKDGPAYPDLRSERFADL